MKTMYISGKLLKHTLLGAVLLLSVASCHDNILDLSPQSSISEETAFGTPAKILAQVNGLYGQLSAESFYGGRYLIFNEQRGNEFSQNDGTNSTGANVWNQSITGSGDFVNAVWSAAYFIIAVLIMIATFGCNNGLILAGARVYYSMARDGIFFKRTAELNKHSVPEFALWTQCLVASILCLSGKYGDLLDMITFVAVIFYVLTIAGILF